MTSRHLKIFIGIFLCSLGSFLMWGQESVAKDLPAETTLVNNEKDDSEITNELALNDDEDFEGDDNFYYPLDDEELFIEDDMAWDESLYVDDDFSHGDIEEDPYVIPSGMGAPTFGPNLPVVEPALDKEFFPAPCVEEVFAEFDSDICEGRPAFLGTVIFPYFFVEGGYQQLLHLPTFSYGIKFAGSAYIPAPPLAVKNDCPGSSYVKFGLGSYLPTSLFPYWMGTATSFEVEGFYTTSALATLMNDIIKGGRYELPPITGGLTFTDNTAAIWGFISRQYEYGSLDFKLQTTYPLFLYGFPFAAKLFGDFSLAQFQQIYGISYFDPNPAAQKPSLVLTESLDTLYYDVGGGVKVGYPFPWNFIFFIQVAGYLSPAHTNFNGHQEISNQDGTFSFFQLDTDKNVLNGKFKGSMGLETCRGPISVSLVANYEYWGYLPRVKNFQPTLPTPATIIATPVTIGNAFLSTYSFGLRVMASY